jgi:cytochrome b involved in lipid metabolism
MSFTISNPKNFPPPYKRRRYYTPEEVKVHNLSNDCWVSFFNEVYDLTELIQKNYSKLIDPIIKYAGQDITHWFDPMTREPKQCIIQSTGLQGFFTPDGPYLNIPPEYPDAEWNYNFDIP